MTTVRIGTASPASQPTTPSTLHQLSLLARRAARLGLDILVLPEAYVGGYPRGQSFGSIIGNRSPEGREEFRRYFRQAVDLGDTVEGGGAGAGERWVRREIGGASSEKESGQAAVRGDGSREEMERIARESGVFLVVGCIERAGGSLYCAAVYVDPERGMIGKRRKVMPTASERLIWAQGAPSTLRAVSATIRGVRVNLAAAICWENYMPLLRQSLYAQNINLYLAPTADARPTWLGLMQTVAIEGRCFVVSSNMAARKHPAAEEALAPQQQQQQQQQQQEEEEDEDEEDEEEDEEMDVKPRSSDGARRNSCMTSEGFEIALPPSPRLPRSTDGDTSPRTRKPRRNSCITDDGFEIALPRGTNGHHTSPGTTTNHHHHHHHHHKPRRSSCFTEEGFEIALPADDTTPAPKRRKSVIVEDGHEIVLGENPPPRNRTISLPVRRKGDEWLCRGGSCIVSPFGDVLAGPQWEDDEGIIWADVDFEDCIRGRLDLDTAGSYSRNDSFKFSVEGLPLDPLPY